MEDGLILKREHVLALKPLLDAIEPKARAEIAHAPNATHLLEVLLSFYGHALAEVRYGRG